MNRLQAVALFGLCLVSEACAPAVPAASVQLSPVTITPPVPTEIVPTPIPATPTFAGCTYVWGSQELPELSRLLNAQLQLTSMDASGLAYAYGQYCVYADGRETLGIVETDYRIGVKIKDVRDEYALGEWIYKVMNIVLDLPSDQVLGYQPGRVDFNFKQPDPADLFVTVPIDKYLREADDLKGADLLHLFLPNP